MRTIIYKYNYQGYQVKYWEVSGGFVWEIFESGFLVRRGKAPTQEAVRKAVQKAIRNYEK